MHGIKFRVEWDEAPGVTHPVLARTWARLELAVGDSVVTTVLDSRTGGTRTGVYGPMFVLAEWIVRNYWFVLSECAPAFRAHPAWLRRHSLVTAREGTSLPDLQLFAMMTT